MARRFTRGRGRAGAPRRETAWFSFPFASNNAAASATAVLQYSLNAAALAMRPFTVVRTHFNWYCLSDQVAASETFIGNFGLAVVSDQATAIGITAVPTPATDLGSDLWFLIDQWPADFQLINANGQVPVDSRKIDSKAMRRVDIGEDIVGVIEAGIGGSGVVVKTVGRMLVKLH